MKIAWSVKVPDGAKLKVKDGEKIEVGELVYEFRQNSIERLPLVGWPNLNGNDRKSILQNIIKKDVVNDEVIGKIGLFTKSIIKSPGSGKCLGVDEFGNIELEIEKDEKYLSPISAKKIRIEENKIIFELKGIEFEGDGINQFKAWGDFDGLMVDDMNQINSLQNKQMVIIKDNIDAAIKAEAVGAAGLILVNIDKVKDLDDCDIPMILVKEEDALKIIKAADSRPTKIWLNATTGQGLLVLE